MHKEKFVIYYFKRPENPYNAMRVIFTVVYIQNKKKNLRKMFVPTALGNKYLGDRCRYKTRVKRPQKSYTSNFYSSLHQK